MRIVDEFAMSAGALVANPIRTALTMLGVIFGVGCVICMAAIGAGAEARVAAQIRAFGANVLLVNPAVARREAQHGGGARRSLTSADARAIEDLPLVSAAAPSVFGSVQVVLFAQKSSERDERVCKLPGLAIRDRRAIHPFGQPRL